MGPAVFPMAVLRAEEDVGCWVEERGCGGEGEEVGDDEEAEGGGGWGWVVRGEGADVGCCGGEVEVHFQADADEAGREGVCLRHTGRRGVWQGFKLGM